MDRALALRWVCERTGEDRRPEWLVLGLLVLGELPFGLICCG